MEQDIENLNIAAELVLKIKGGYVRHSIRYDLARKILDLINAKLDEIEKDVEKELVEIIADGEVIGTIDVHKELKLPYEKIEVVPTSDFIYTNEVVEIVGFGGESVTTIPIKACICGHVRKAHISIISGTETSACLACDCGGYLEEDAHGIDEASDGRDRTTR